VDIKIYGLPFGTWCQLDELYNFAAEGLCLAPIVLENGVGFSSFTKKIKN